MKMNTSMNILARRYQNVDTLKIKVVQIILKGDCLSWLRKVRTGEKTLVLYNFVMTRASTRACPRGKPKQG